MSAEFKALWEKAEAAGMVAAKAVVPVPMNVTDGTQVWHVPDGVCGFAWVKFPGNTPFGRWAKKAGKASKSYTGGLMYWVTVGGQAMQLKEAYADAFAKVLNEGGVKAYADSRMD